MREASLVERFGATAFPDLDGFDLTIIGQVLYIRDIFRQAGRKGQEDALSQRDWEVVTELNALAGKVKRAGV